MTSIDITTALALFLRTTEGPAADVITQAIKEIEHLRASLHNEQDRTHELEGLIIAAADTPEASPVEDRLQDGAC